MRIYFNHRRQWADVYLHDCTPNTFERRGGGRWAYWLPAAERGGRRGLFGEMHFVSSRVRPDVVAHEILHLVLDWVRVGRVGHINQRNEERVALLMDELTRNFWREYERRGKGEM